MRLERRIFPVTEATLGRATRLAGTRLAIDRSEIADLVLRDDRVARCAVELVAPGEDARIVHICDTVEPQWRTEGGTFAGWTSPIRTVGDGVTHRLEGVGVTVCAELPWRGTGGIQTPRENIAEMRGDLAALNPLSRLANVVLEVTLRPDLPDEECDRAVHVAEMRAAEHLAREATKDREPASVDVFELGEVDGSLPRVVYIDQITSQGPYAGTFYYGGYLDRLMPTVVHPNEILDGALADGNVAGPWIRTPTIVHQNNPVITGLYRDHGQGLAFAGVILTRGHYYGMDDKVPRRAAGLEARALAPRGRRDPHLGERRQRDHGVPLHAAGVREGGHQDGVPHVGARRGGGRRHAAPVLRPGGRRPS